MSDARPPTNLRWSLRVSAVSALVLAFVLELSGLSTAPPHWWVSVFLGTSFLADAIVIWLVLVVAISVTNRVMLSVGLLGALVVLVAVANRIKLNVRSEPIYPSDIDFIREPGFLSTMVAPALLVVAGIVVVALVVGAVIVSRRFERRMLPVWPRQLSPRGRVLALAVRAGVLALALTLLAGTAHFNDPGNGWRKFYELGAGRWRYWNQMTNYQAHGFVGGFLYNMPSVAMKTPPGYSPATMAAIEDKYAALADRINRTRTGSLDDTNVVIVLSESFSDPTRLQGFDLDEDPIPRTRALMKGVTAGTMMAQLYGGGTANMEFETLTGQSIGLFTPQLSSPYQMLVPGFEDFPSAVGWFASHGHEPIAIHPYNTGMYKRKQVYRTFGFDEFVHDTTMAEHDTIDHSRFISDASAFDEVQRQIASHQQPLLVNLVTMQNHIPMTDSYDDPIHPRGLHGSERNRVGNYARGLRHTDDALAGFLHDLEQSPEKTVVVFYGDHLPGIYGSGTKHANQGLALHETPFFLWSNRGTPTRTLPLTSPIHFLPLLYEVANAPVPPYFALLAALRGRVSAIEQGRVYAPDGTKLDLTDLDPATQAVVDDARLVQYDFSIGERWSVDRMWPGALPGGDQDKRTGSDSSP